MRCDNLLKTLWLIVLKAELGNIQKNPLQGYQPFLSQNSCKGFTLFLAVTHFLSLQMQLRWNNFNMYQWLREISRDRGGIITTSILGWTVKRSLRNPQVAHQRWEPTRSNFKCDKAAIDLHDPLMMFKLSALRNSSHFGTEINAFLSSV